MWCLFTLGHYGSAFGVYSSVVSVFYASEGASYIQFSSLVGRFFFYRLEVYYYYQVSGGTLGVHGVYGRQGSLRIISRLIDFFLSTFSLRYRSEYSAVQRVFFVGYVVQVVQR